MLNTMEAGRKWQQYLAAASANLGILSVGMCMVWSSPMIPKLKKIDETPLDSVIDGDQESWIGSLITLGGALGPLYTGLFAERIGRKYAILSGSIPLVIGWILTATATHVIQIYVARTIWGLAMGQLFTLVPLYVGEIAEKEVRGGLGSFLEIFLVTGFFLTFCIGPYVSYLTFNLIGLTIPVIFFVLFYSMPDSPCHLLLKGKRDNAIVALTKLRGKSKEGVQEELDYIESSFDKTVSESNISLLWSVKGNVKALYLSFGLVTFQQLSGINVVLFYLESIFALTGTNITADISSIIIGAMQIIVSCLTALLTDKYGRRVLFIISSLGMTAGMALLGLYFILSYNQDPSVKSLAWLPVSSLIIFVCSFCIGFGTLTSAVIGELFDPKIKAMGSTIINISCWVIGFLITKFFSSLVLLVGLHNAFWILGSISLIGFFFIYFLLPETKQKTLKEIQDMLNDKPIVTSKG